MKGRCEMSASSMLVGGSAIIRDEKGNVIAESKIVDYDSKFMIIKIKGKLAHLRKDASVKVLILRETNTYEFNGIVRIVMSDVADIALSKGGKKENRAAVRYKIQSVARIEHLVAKTVLLSLPVPADVTVTNISATGLCFESERTFRVDGKLEIKLKIGDSDVSKVIRVVRIHPKSETEIEYGCAFG
ncbi:MAG: PilZ domain-containing protein [Oscillospiraceae bacterium]